MYLFCGMAKKKAASKTAAADQELRKLGERFKKLRKEAGFKSAEKFALEHDFSRVQYGRWETGMRNISYKNLQRLAKAFGITISEMLDGL